MQNKNDKYFLKVLSTLSEDQRRWFVARKAIARGRGGIVSVSELTGVTRSTIKKGIDELKSRNKLDARGTIRKSVGGRLALEEKDPEFKKTLVRVMEDSTGGDPMSPLLWTNKFCETIAKIMTDLGFAVSASTIHLKLQEQGYTLQSNSKTIEGKQNPDMDSQFLKINKKN